MSSHAFRSSSNPTIRDGRARLTRLEAAAMQIVSQVLRRPFDLTASHFLVPARVARRSDGRVGASLVSAALGPKSFTLLPSDWTRQISSYLQPITAVSFSLHVPGPLEQTSSAANQSYRTDRALRQAFFKHAPRLVLHSSGLSRPANFFCASPQVWNIRAI